MKRLCLIVAVTMWWLAFGQARAETKVLLIGKAPDHPHGTHMYMHTARLLAECLALTDDVATEVSQGWPEDDRVLDGVDAMVVYATPAAELLLDGPHRSEVVKLMDSGVGLTTIHWASSVRKENFDRLGGVWLEYLGGTWISNVGYEMGDSTLMQLQPEHPISRGWRPFELHDEFYQTPTITDRATPVLQVTSRATPTVVGWTYERPDGGRAFGTTLGHFYSNFQIDQFRQMIVNGILWTAHVEIPAAGAPIDVHEDALRLPPPK